MQSDVIEGNKHVVQVLPLDKDSAREVLIYLSLNLGLPVLYKGIPVLFSGAYSGLYQAVAVFALINLANLYRAILNRRFRVIYLITILANVASFFFFGIMSYVVAVVMVPLILF